MLVVEQFLPGCPDAAFSIAGPDLDVLWSTARRPALSLAVWCRRPRPVELAALLDQAPFCVAVEGHATTVTTRLAAALPGPAPGALIEDMHGLAMVFGLLSGSTRLRLRLEGLIEAGCPRFHTDQVALRLLCTYAGPGTEWLALGGGGPAAAALPQDDAELPAGLVPHTLAPWDVALLKGERWPGLTQGGCIHRSPRQRGGDERRIVFCIDEIMGDQE